MINLDFKLRQEIYRDMSWLMDIQRQEILSDKVDEI